jgi:hypothetical protein
MVWYNGLISPGSVGTTALINVLIVVVLGGMRHPVGAFLGAVVFVLLQNFAIDLFDRERFNLVIGTVFLVVVLFSPDGLLGWWSRLSARLPRAARAGGADARYDRPSGLAGRPAPPPPGGWGGGPRGGGGRSRKTPSGSGPSSRSPRLPEPLTANGG